MIKNKSVLAIIPARGGSKGIPKKNIKLLLGKPLIQYTIDVAKQSNYIDKIVVSTDCNEISSISESLGAKIIKRSKELSTDDSSVSDAIRYTISKLEDQGEEYDFILLLEPTSPLRDIEIINTSIEKLIDEKVECIATFSETDLPPHRIWKLDENIARSFIVGANPWLPRQKLEKGYQLNGLLYGMKTDIFMNMHDFESILTQNITPIITERKISIDIDDMLDFKLIELLMKENNE